MSSDLQTQSLWRHRHMSVALISKEIILKFRVFLYTGLLSFKHCSSKLFISSNLVRDKLTQLQLFEVYIANSLRRNTDAAALRNTAPKFYPMQSSKPEVSPCCSSSKTDRCISLYSMGFLSSVLNSDRINSYSGL